MSLKERKNYIIAFRPWSLVASTIPALITITYIFSLKQIFIRYQFNKWIFSINRSWHFPA